MDIKPGEITDILKREIKEYDREIDVAETGTVLSSGDGIARVYGLDQAMAGVDLAGGILADHPIGPMTTYRAGGRAAPPRAPS